MSIKDWPANERPREKLLRSGSEALSSAELLAIILNHGRAGQTALDLARDLLKRFDGLRGLLCAPRERVCAARGLGVVRYAELQAAMPPVTPRRMRLPASFSIRAPPLQESPSGTA